MGDVLHIAVCDEGELVLSTEDPTLQHARAFWRDVEFLPDPVDKAACAVGLSAAAGSCTVVTLATANVLTLHPGEERAFVSEELPSLRRELLAVEFDKLGFDLVGLQECRGLVARAREIGQYRMLASSAAVRSGPLGGLYDVGTAGDLAPTDPDIR